VANSAGDPYPGIRFSTDNHGHRLVDHMPPSRRSLAAIACGFLTSLVAYGRFPSGQPPAFYWPLIALCLPVTATAVVFSLQALWNRDPVRDRDPESQAIYDAIVFRMVLFIIGLHGLLVAAMVGAFAGRSWAPRTVVILFGLLVMSIGNLLPRTRPNLELGVHTRRTLSNRTLWMRTHRVGGRLAVGLGVVIVISGMFLSRATIPIVVTPATLAAVLVWCISYRWQSRQ